MKIDFYFSSFSFGCSYLFYTINNCTKILAQIFMRPPNPRLNYGEICFFPDVSGGVYNCFMNERLTMTELETELYSLMAECEAEKVEGNSTDENADPRLERIGNILTMLQVFDWEAYKRVAIAKFNVSPDYFED